MAALRRALGAVAACAVVGVLAGCGGSGGESPSYDTVITVDGQPIPGLDQSKVGCSRGDGRIFSDGPEPAASDPGLILVAEDSNPPQLDYYSFKMGGVLYTAKAGKKGDGTVSVSGDRFTVTGTAQSVDPPVVDKPFEISLTCVADS